MLCENIGNKLMGFRLDTRRHHNIREVQSNTRYNKICKYISYAINRNYVNDACIIWYKDSRVDINNAILVMSV